MNFWLGRYQQQMLRVPESLFLGVDGGQSHTEAVIADENGRILGRGVGGPSNHAEQPGGRERLRKAVSDSVAAALANATVPRIDKADMLESVTFRSGHFGMTGGADFKEEIIKGTVNCGVLSVGHDAPTALFGATAGEPGVVAIAGTGSVVYADDKCGHTSQIGGLGYLFSDEGSGFWLAAQTIRLAIKEKDGLIADAGLQCLVVEHFGVRRVRDVTDAFYNGMITRDEIARLSVPAHDAAVAGNPVLRQQIEHGAGELASWVRVAAARTGFSNYSVSGVGGMFKASLMNSSFQSAIAKHATGAVYRQPIFSPAIGALLIAYEQAGSTVTRSLVSELLASFETK